jgi:hypothetical protein
MSEKRSDQFMIMSARHAPMKPEVARAKIKVSPGSPLAKVCAAHRTENSARGPDGNGLGEKNGAQD